MIAQRGLCIHCGRSFVLRTDGTVRGHSTTVQSHKEPCPGSFQQPRGIRS